MPTTTTRPRADARSSVSPRLSCQTIVFMNGPSLTGKTTAAGKLGCRLGIPTLATHEHRSVMTNGMLDGQKRLSRYLPTLTRAQPHLAAGRSLILDASFLDHTRRAPLYALARRFGTRLIAIRTSCDDREIIRARAHQRATDPHGWDRDVGLDAYLITRDEVRANPLEADPEFWELEAEVIEFHTGREAYVACAPDAGPDTRMVASFLRESGLLASPRRCAAGRSRP